ncbi:MAG: DUF1553 domain-containing protein [Verrucomicrobia bacterium]|nr:DUF1553 domain-containing protein [Verrucomicrobiota bacterium]
MIGSLLIGGSLAASPVRASADASAPDPAGLEFFESKVRPVLVEHCYECHSAQAEKVKGGLLLDTREGLLKGGDTGPALVAGEPERSLLIKAVRYTDENLQMPPKNKKLSSEQIADLEAWVRLGAPYPPTAVIANRQSPIANQQSQIANPPHWAFEPVTKPPVAPVKNNRWVQSPLDAFILAQLEARGLSPSPAADKRTLIRRAYFDLVGLPPTPAEVAAFLADRSPEAFARVVDHLLSSPRYGERWGRYWLDVARYADTKGYVFEEERRYPYAFTYRDYVIRALNEDLPYDRFLIEQIAADQLDLGEDKRPLAALGFLTLGRRFLNNPHDIIDDRIDVVARGTMALTVGCARCHDHKYDPIPMKDYYSLYGVFASCNEPSEKPLIGSAGDPKAYDEYLAEKKKRVEERDTFRQQKEAEARAELRKRAGDYLLTAFEAQQLNDSSKAEKLARERKLNPGVVRRWTGSLESWSKAHHPIFAPWFAFAALPAAEFTSKGRDLAAQFAANEDRDKPLNPRVGKIFSGEPPATMKELADRYGQLFVEIEKRWQDSRAAREKGAAGEQPGQAESATGLPDASEEALRQVLYADDAPGNIPSSEVPRLFDVPTAQKNRALQRKVEELDATHPGAPPRAMVLQDNSTPATPHVFLRGNPNNRGPEVPRQFLGLLAGPGRKPFTQGSGRLELAQAIASRDNPLTARVLVNRVWLQHFGAPLVRTPADFGVRSEPPTHPALLDWLAAQFMADGWSLKKLHRQIMLSSAYQQSSANHPRSAQLDPNNQWLWRMNRRRLDFEAMRDTLLAVSGTLDLSAGGRAVELTTEPFAPRRTVYGFVERQNLPSLFRTFDFASPDTTSPQRFSTTVPQQALFMMNSPFVVEQARHFLGRPVVASASEDERRIQALYEVAFQRSPAKDELEAARRFLQRQPAAATSSPEQPVWQYGYGEFDEAAKRVKAFHALPHFTGEAWQGGAKLPDEKLGWVTLNARGGHVGNDLQHAAIRRWTAPRDGVLTISGELKHDSDKGDGVRARIVSSRAGELLAQVAHNAKAPMTVERVEVKRGDTIDLIADCREGVDSDSFIWVPKLKLIESASGAATGSPQEWDARADFSGPPKDYQPLTPWEKYAQVLLLANELVFVD